eukprot:SAG11_NODE_8586_length_998_cov_1.946607_1_plen_264_part_01
MARLLLLLLLLARPAVSATTTKQLPLYKDATQPIGARVSDLLSKMTLEEKVNQTLNDFADGAFGGGIPKDEKLQEVIASEGMRYLFKFCTKDLADCINTINHFQTIAKHKTRLGIPISFSEETLHGSIFAPQLPMPINLGCSWNESLVEQGFKHTAGALTMVGGNIGLSPVVNMFPDPRFGRLQGPRRARSSLHFLSLSLSCVRACSLPLSHARSRARSFSHSLTPSLPLFLSGSTPSLPRRRGATRQAAPRRWTGGSAANTLR